MIYYELEKNNRDDSGIAVKIGFKAVTTGKLRLQITGTHRENIGIYRQTKGMLCHTKTITFLKQIKPKKNKYL